jgi:hypothetical protein
VQNVCERFYVVKRNVFIFCACEITICSRLLNFLDVWLLDLSSECMLCMYKTFVNDSIFQKARFFCLLLECDAHHDNSRLVVLFGHLWCLVQVQNGLNDATYCIRDVLTVCVVWEKFTQIVITSRIAS